jgi:hypothetical protein
MNQRFYILGLFSHPRTGSGTPSIPWRSECWDGSASARPWRHVGIGVLFAVVCWASTRIFSPRRSADRCAREPSKIARQRQRDQHPARKARLISQSASRVHVKAVGTLQVPGMSYRRAYRRMEAIRHRRWFSSACRMISGVGGTINMNRWFTNYQ